MESVEEMATVMVTGNYPSLIGWISEMERYCSGIDAMRDL
jgi:cell division inhibitor SulA